MKKNVDKFSISLIVLVFVIALAISSCGRKVQYGIQPGEIKVENGKLVVPGGEVYREGILYEGEANLPAGEIAGVIVNNQTYIVYNPGFDYIDTLDPETNALSIAMFALKVAEHYKHGSLSLTSMDKPVRLKEVANQALSDIIINFGKCSWGFTGTSNYDHEFVTGIGMQRISDSTNRFTNCKVRWSAIESGDVFKYIPPADRVDGIVGTLANAISNIVGDPTGIDIETNNLIRTYGAIDRFVYTPVSLGLALANNAWRESLQKAYSLNPQVFAKLNTIDLLYIMYDIVKQIAGLVPGSECAYIPTALDARFESFMNGLFELDIPVAQNAIKNIANDTTECLIRAACDVATAGACEVVNTALDVLSFAGGVGESILVGSIDTASSLAYDDYAVNPFEYKITLTWGDSPRDLDLHLWLPDATHVYYRNRTALPYAELDVDDTTGYGPENVTIYQRQNGTYSIAVHNYSNESSLVGSSATVTIQSTRSNEFTTYEVPSSGNDSYRWWIVAEIDGDSGAIYPINRISESPPN